MVRRQAAAGQDTVDMRMPLERLPPCVQNAEEAKLGPQTGWVGANLQQGCGTSVEQEAE